MLHEVSAGESGEAWSDALERGRIVRFASCPIELPPSEDLDFLRGGLAPFLKDKNVSYYPEADRLTGLHAPAEGRDLTAGVAERLLGAVLGAGRRAFPMLRVIDTSPYDRAMRRFHNWMKDTPSFRDSAEGFREISFAPFSAWMVLTDGVSHACIRGQHALVDTFLVPLANCRLTSEAPFRVLAGAG